jgi:predicted GIY-YIG superfamily endonuclease
MLTFTPEVSLRAKDYTMSKQAAVYLMTNRTDGTLYTGVTNDLIQRVWQHKNGITARNII